MNEYIFSSESVTEGHPDKIADQISDAVLDAVIKDDPFGRVACETLVTTGLVLVSGEITTKCYVDIPTIAREVIKDIGYTDATYGFDYETCAVLTSIDQQSLLSKGSIVYVNRGFNQGVRRGNLMKVVKENIMPEPDPDPEKHKYPTDWLGKLILPDITIGTILILESRPDTATAMVVTSKDIIECGDSVVGMAWEEVPKEFSTIVKCPIE